MMAKDNGGPAFPRSGDKYSGSDSQDGMSLRDYFAGQALHLYTERPDLTLENIATSAYAIADALIAERAK